MLTAPAFVVFIKATGKASDNLTTAAWWHPAARYKGKDLFGTTENYNKLFTAKYKIDPDYSPASASAAGAILQMAIERAGSLDRKKVREELSKINDMTFWGPVKFGPTGQITSLDPPVIQIQGGKHIAIYPASIKQGELLLGVK